jgi:hypothetical protein
VVEAVVEAAVAADQDADDNKNCFLKKSKINKNIGSGTYPNETGHVPSNHLKISTNEKVNTNPICNSRNIEPIIWSVY